MSHVAPYGGRKEIRVMALRTRAIRLKTEYDNLSSFAVFLVKLH